MARHKSPTPELQVQIVDDRDQPLDGLPDYACEEIGKALAQFIYERKMAHVQRAAL